MDMQSVGYVLFAFGPSFFLGMYLAKRNGPLSRMSYATLMDNSNSYWWTIMILKIISLFVLALGWAVVVVYLAFMPENRMLLLLTGFIALESALVVVLMGILLSRVLRWMDKIEQEEKHLYGEGAGY